MNTIPAVAGQRQGLLPAFAYPIIVITGVLFAHVALWNAGIPLGDEGVHILQSLRILTGEISSFNPYYLLYALLLSVVTAEPVIAHLIMRFMVSMGSTLGLYLMLRSFRNIGPLAATLTALAWAGSALCTPYTQLANNSLLCLTLILPALAYLMHRPSWSGVTIVAIATLWAAHIRPEYYAPFLLLPFGGAWLVFLHNRSATAGQRRTPIRSTIVLALLILSALATAFKPGEAGVSLQSYLLQGLGQCYGVYYRRLHPEEKFNPMTEYEGVLDRMFGNPKTFTEALANNPAEAARYFLYNGSTNLQLSVRELLRGRKGVASSLILLIVLSGSLIGAIRHVRIRSRREPTQTGQLLTARVLLLLLLGSAASASILLLIPDPRYWASLAPLIYLWLAWSLEQIVGALNGSRWQLLLLPLAVLLLDRPEFVGRRSYKDVIDAVRTSVPHAQGKPVIAGNFIVGLATYAFRGNAVQINAYNGLSIDGLRTHRYDVFVADGLASTAFWQANREFLDAFVRSPGNFGYRVLPIGIESGTEIFVRSE